MHNLGTNLGGLLKQAGVRGGRPQMSADQLQSIAIPKPAEPEHSRVAMRRLPEKFQALAQVTEGKNFRGALMELLENCDRTEVTSHTIFGLLQMAHDHRDNVELAGSQRKSFSRHVIPALLRAKGRLEQISQRGCCSVCEILLDELRG